MSKLFENVRVPVLFISGECDRIASPRMAQAAAQLIPGARYIELKGGSHYLQFEKHSLTACIIDQFLRDGMARRLTNTIVLTQKGSAHTWLKTKTLVTVS